MTQQAITIRDVAARANVSTGTVSRILNGATGVNPKRLARVHQAIDDLGYRKSGLARALASRRSGAALYTGNIGLVFTDMTAAWAGHPLLSRYISGVERACREQGYHPIIELRELTEESLPTCIEEKKVDGLLIKATNIKPLFLEKLPPELPVVGLSTSEPSLQITQVAPDNIKSGAAVTEYLWESGHRRIAFVCPEGRHRMFIGRFQGYEEFLRNHGAFEPDLVTLNPEQTVSDQPATSYPDVSMALEKLWNLPVGQRPTAVIAANDWTAAGLYLAAGDMGIRIPEELSVVGIDNALEVCNLLRPALTSYEIPLVETAYAGAMQLFTMIRNPSAPRIISFQSILGKLVKRASVRTIVRG